MRGTGKYPMKYFHYFSTSLKMEHSGHFPSSMPQHSPLQRTSGSLWGVCVGEQFASVLVVELTCSPLNTDYRASLSIPPPIHPARPLRSGRASAPFMFPPLAPSGLAASKMLINWAGSVEHSPLWWEIPPDESERHQTLKVMQAAANLHFFRKQSPTLLALLQETKAHATCMWAEMWRQGDGMTFIFTSLWWVDWGVSRMHHQDSNLTKYVRKQ